MKPHCRFCKKKKKRLVIHVRTATKTYFSCTACNTERLRRYRKTKRGKLAIKRANTRYEEKNKERRRAWAAVNYAGLKAKQCSSCGVGGLIHMHHPDPLKRLEVIPLCPLCHKWEHKKLSTG